MSITNESTDLTQDQEIKLAVLREASKIFNRLDHKFNGVLNAEFTIEEFCDEVYEIKEKISEELDDYKSEVNLCDAQWDIDEDFDMSVLHER